MTKIGTLGAAMFRSRLHHLSLAAGLALFMGDALAEIKIGDAKDFRVGGPIYDVRVVKLHRDISKPYYLVAVTDSDRHLKLIGLDAGPRHLWRRASARTTGPARQFDLDAMNGLVFTAYQDRESELRITTWDASWILDSIKRLEDWEGERVYRVTAAYLRHIDGYYRFVTALSDSERKHRIIVWDIEPDTGRIHRRGHAVGGTIGEVAVVLLDDNVVDFNGPTLVVTAVTDAENDLWTRVWKVDRDGNVTAGAGIGAGRAYKVGLARLDSSLLLASVRESQGRLKMISYKVGDGGDSIERMGDYLFPNPVFAIAACKTNSMGAFTAVENHSQALSIFKWGVLGQGRDIRLDEASEPRSTVDRVACASSSTLLLAAVRGRQYSENSLAVFPYIP